MHLDIGELLILTTLARFQALFPETLQSVSVVDSATHPYFREGWYGECGSKRFCLLEGAYLNLFASIYICSLAPLWELQSA